MFRLIEHALIQCQGAGRWGFSKSCAIIMVINIGTKACELKDVQSVRGSLFKEIISPAC